MYRYDSGATWVIVFAALFATGSPQPVRASESIEQLPEFSWVEELVNDHFAARKDFRRSDLISKRDVTPIFASLKNAGWQVADEADILALILDEGSAVVRTLRTRDGQQFMRKVAGYRLIYDRLDRITRESGGQRLVADLVKLPDAQRYAKMKPQRGVPSMLEFLPKKKSGKRRRVADYDKPTGRIYTIEAFLERLQESHTQAKKKARGERAQAPQPLGGR
jgi:hypothetical protein